MGEKNVTSDGITLKGECEMLELHAEADGVTNEDQGNTILVPSEGRGNNGTQRRSG